MALYNYTAMPPRFLRTSDLAKAAGMKCVAIPNQDTRALDLSAADAVMPSLLAVRDHLDGLVRRKELLP